jgi:hypothetical protein
MSSDMNQTCGWRRSTAPSACSSSREYTAPLGLLGEFSISHLVRGVMAASSCSGVILNPVDAVAGSVIGIPIVIRTISMYDTHAGTATITSSPASTVACSAL